jgi:hypothetical protein
MSLIARFTVTAFEPRALDGLMEDGPNWVGAVSMRKVFSSGITGESVGLFVSSGEVEGERSYLAAERITGALDDGSSGSVTVHHGGLESSPQTWFGHIVPHTGTGDFAGWAGTARIEHDDGGGYFVIDLA